jgi:YD repeat-containing protein
MFESPIVAQKEMQHGKHSVSERTIAYQNLDHHYNRFQTPRERDFMLCNTCRWIYFSASVLILSASLHSTPVFAATPHSQARSCGSPGQSSCPPSPPIITPWIYSPSSPWYSNPQVFASVGDAVSWYQGKVETGAQGWCTANYTGSTPTTGTPSYQYNTEIGFDEYFNFAVTAFKNSVPPCSSGGGGWNTQELVHLSRSVQCPSAMTLVYQASPLVGPYCTLPAATAIPLKQNGSCQTCSGVTVKGQSVNVSNGNAYQTETDYVGGGANPLNFTRSYNSLTGYLRTFYAAGRPLASAVMGEAWSATYFQFLLPLAVTDGATTYNTVYAYRPDGRVITFNEYSGVYSPDGDVVDRLVPISGGGWEYQTADDTIETYDANGQLGSIAARGQAPLTISRPDAFGPLSAVSDAFGHALQFSYLYDSTGAERLSSVTDSAGKVIQYAYDTNGNLTSVTYPDTTVRKYAYKGYPATNALASLTDENNVAYANWTYSTWGNQVLTSQRSGGVDAYSFTYTTNGSGTVTSVAVHDPFAQSRTYAQQLISGVNRTTTSTGACPGCGDDQTRVLDADGNITSRTDWNGNQTTYVYDTANNLETSRTEAYGTPQARTITTSWDPNWRQPDLISEPNRTTAFTYDSLGNALTKTVTDTSVTPNVSRTWTYTYDSTAGCSPPMAPAPTSPIPRPMLTTRAPPASNAAKSKPLPMPWATSRPSTPTTPTANRSPSQTRTAW